MNHTSSTLFDRQTYLAINASGTRRLLFQFGTGGGFGAEVMRLLTAVIQCMCHGYEFALGQQPPLGFAVERGWPDYFEPVWPEVPLSAWAAQINRHEFPLNRVPIARPLARLALSTIKRNHIFMFDELPRYSQTHLERKGLPGDYWAQVKVLTNALWVYNHRVRAAIEKINLPLALLTPYDAIHVRRGDKITEVPYVPLSRYVDALRKSRAARTIFVATDDVSVLVELRQLLPQHHLLTSPSQAGRGYDQATFNRLSPGERFDQTVQFIAELEILRGSRTFVGSSPSNVYYLLRHLRGDDRVVDVGWDNA